MEQNRIPSQKKDMHQKNSAKDQAAFSYKENDTTQGIIFTGDIRHWLDYDYLF